MKRLLLFLLTVTWLLPGQIKTRLTAGIDAERIGLDDVVVLTLTFKGVQNPAPPDVSTIKDFRVAGTSQSTQASFVNGRASYTTDFIYSLQPLKTGKLSIPSFTYKFQGATLITRSFLVTVVAGSVKPRSAPARRPSLFDDDFFKSPFDRRPGKPLKTDLHLESTVSRKAVVTGEQIVFKVQLVTANRVRSVNLLPGQSFPGFWQEWYPVPRSIEGEERQQNGKTYQVYQIRKAALFPVKTGELTIPGLRFEMVLEDEGFAFFSNPRKVVRTAPEHKIRVKALPASAQGLPVGNFSFSVTPESSTVDISDLVTVHVEIRGNGNLKALSLPEFAKNDLFRSFPAKTGQKFDFSRTPLQGTLNAEIPLSFNRSGAVSLEGLLFRYYDPRQNRIVSLRSKPLILKISGKSPVSGQTGTVLGKDIVRRGVDIRFIKTGGIADQSKLFYRSRYFFWLILLPFVINLLLIMKKRFWDRGFLQSRLMRSRRLLGGVLWELKQADSLASVSGVIERYLSARTGLEMAQMNRVNVEQALSRQGVRDAELRRLIQFMEKAEQMRYSPDRPVSENHRQDIQQLMDLLKKIDGRLK